MRTAKTFYRVFVSLTAALLVAGWASTHAFAQDFGLPELPSGASLPSLSGHSAGFELETPAEAGARSEEHTSELQSHSDLVCRLLLEKKKKKQIKLTH